MDKKLKTLGLIFSIIPLAIVIGVGVFVTSTRQISDVNAATTETKRVWMKNSITSTWDADGAGTAIHYWGGSQGTTFPGVRVSWDSANSLVYFDLPSDVTTYMFVRVSGSDPITDWGAKTADLSYADSIGKYFDLTGPIAWGGATTPGSFVSFTPATTTVVANFAATIDTSAEACSQSAAQAAVNAYNAMSSFEQNQFDALSFGTPARTGSQTLEYLRLFYDISTPLNSNFSVETQNNGTPLIIAFGVLGITTLAGIILFRFSRKSIHL